MGCCCKKSVGGELMITPDYLNEIIEGTEAIVTKVQAKILNKICKRIISSFNANEENIIIPSTIKNMHQLMDLGMTQKEIQEYVEKSLPAIEKEVKKAFLQSAQEISNHNTDIAVEIIKKEGFDIEIPQFEDVGLPKESSQLNMTATEIRKLEQIYNSTNKTVKNLCKTMPASGLNLYIQACNNAFTEIQSGISPNTAIIDAIHQVSSNGLQVVSYDSGHVDRAEVAIARAVRTGVNKANSEIVLTRCAEMGVNYVRVSQHFGARVTKQEDFTNHAWWQGKVYSLDWNKEQLKGYNGSIGNDEHGFKWLKRLKKYLSGLNKPKYPDFVDVCGYGDIRGCAGINCRHTFSPFYPDMMEEPKQQYDEEENAKRYEQTQKQRSMERSVRRTKQELVDLGGLDTEEAEQRKLLLKNKLKKQERALLDYCKEHDLKVQNFRTEIGVRNY